VSSIVQPDLSTRRKIAPKLTLAAWQVTMFLVVTLWLYWSTLTRLLVQWRQDDNFQHGWIVPIFSAFVIWQERKRLAKIPHRASWLGLILMVAATVLLIIGRLGVELYFQRTSLVFLIAGAIILFAGLECFYALLFPWAFLFLMIPIPTILLNHITFPLQILASKVAAATLPMFGVPVLRLGNVMVLPGQTLNVADACSGIRSLMSLGTLAIIYGYLLEKRIWLRWLLAFASVPIAVAGNSLRVVSTGLMVQYWTPEASEGRFHEAWGLFVFVISLLMLYGLHVLIGLISQERERNSLSANPRKVHEKVEITGQPETAIYSVIRFALASLLIVLVAVFLRAHDHGEVLPSRFPLEAFPQQIGEWQSRGKDQVISEDDLKVLGHPEYILRDYVDQKKAENVNLYIAYWKSQRTGETPHSPQNCLPGNGLAPIENTRVVLLMPGHESFPANRYIVARGDDRSLVLYWFWAHDRGVASEYWNKYYLVKDSIRMNRSDGALVRFFMPMLPGESADAAQKRLSPLVSGTLPMLNDYIPR